MNKLGIEDLKNYDEFDDDKDFRKQEIEKRPGMVNIAEVFGEELLSWRLNYCAVADTFERNGKIY